MAAPAPPPHPRHSRSERRVRRLARTLMVLAFITGFLSYLGIGVLSKFDLAERFQPLSMVCLVVFGVTFGARLLWGLVVLVRKAVRSEEHTSELQSRGHLVCRLLLEKTKARIIA